jgi:hypothetical protein
LLCILSVFLSFFLFFVFPLRLSPRKRACVHLWTVGSVSFQIVWVV